MSPEVRLKAELEVAAAWAVGVWERCRKLNEDGTLPTVRELSPSHIWLVPWMESVGMVEIEPKVASRRRGVRALPESGWEL